VAVATIHPAVWRIRLVVPLPAVDSCALAMAPFTAACSWFLDNEDASDAAADSLWWVEGFSTSPPARTALETALAQAMAAQGWPAPTLSIERLPDTDWVEDNLRGFPPIAAGRFFVHGSHFPGRPPPGRVALKIDAGAAFGSGDHATTRGCLLAIDGLLRRRHPRRALDLGCGSGILAMALAKAAAIPVLAADIDDVAVRVARRNAARNGVAARLRVQVSAGYRHRGISRRRPFDLIVANILAGPLQRLAAALAAHLAADGIAVLSGLLRRQEAAVLAAHRRQGLSLYARLRLQGWSTLVLIRAPATAQLFFRDSQAAHAAASAKMSTADPAARAD
jgi:ribosomal protein L11 methyltransferase